MSAGPYGSASARERREAFASGEIPVAVYGLGKMGLPLAAVYADVAGDVIGVDVDPDVVETVNAGESHVAGEPGLDDLVAEQVERGRLRATTDGATAAAEARVHVVIVPTLLDDGDDPDLTTVEAVADDIAAGLSPGDLVIAESTLPPGTCRDVLVPHLAAESGLDPDEFGVAFCPERTASGTALRDIRGRYPKVVGGVDDESARAAAALYDEITDNAVHVVSDATTAEAVKVFEGVYRDVNIALVNELATAADDLGVSVREAIETANDIPMCHLHDPGPGVGGHCIPNYPYFLLSRVGRDLELTRTARGINEAMPGVTVDLLERELAAEGVALADASVLVLGFTYRPGVAETRSSPAIGVVERLTDAGAEVWGVDPLVDPGEFGARPVAVEDLPGRAFDAAVLVTAQAAFDRIDWEALEPMLVVDGRDALSLADTDHRRYVLGGAAGDRPVVYDEGGRDRATPTPRRTDGGRPRR
ncbi:nucleotide sugar dehydrogenase [Salinilacihabitans rarus]|uniref:nucleotide sugar dehydrogenase n=1 Tax=Salinilacihabitans rarus TaxID=2961596 RepID=UPI0020C8EBCB|nr:nucleotide sugar dehydrogenase [Salinilacihabitans rarus]